MERPALALSTTTVVEVLWPGERLARRVAAAARRARSRYEATIGAHRGWDPRRSVIEHRVPGEARQVADGLFRDGVFAPTGAGLHLLGDAGPSYDRVNHEYRLRTRLHLPWVWPDLPVRLAVGELSPTRCTLRLSLRAHRRVRYPARYFDAAHSALAALERSLAAELE